MGLASDSQDLVSIVTAILLRVNNYFTGAIVDSDGAVLVDDNGDSLGYDQNRVEMTLNCEFIGKQYSLDNSKLYWDLLISFYEQI